MGREGEAPAPLPHAYVVVPRPVRYPWSCGVENCLKSWEGHTNDVQGHTKRTASASDGVAVPGQDHRLSCGSAVEHRQGCVASKYLLD